MKVLRNDMCGSWQYELDLNKIVDVVFYQKGGWSVIMIKFSDTEFQRLGTTIWHDEYFAEYERIIKYWEYFKDSGYDIDHYEDAKRLRA